MKKTNYLFWALVLMAGACSDDKDGENVSGRQEIQIRYEVNQDGGEEFGVGTQGG